MNALTMILVLNRWPDTLHETLNTLTPFVTKKIAIVDQNPDLMRLDATRATHFDAVEYLSGQTLDRLRNKSLELASSAGGGNWALVMDSDEFVDAQSLVTLCGAIASTSNVSAFLLPQFNYVGHGRWATSYALRLFRLDRPIEYSYEIHETISPSRAAQISVTVVLKRKRDIQRADLHRHALLKPHERPITDRAAFAEQYGASSQAIDAIRTFATMHGLTVTNIDQLRRVIELSGTVSSMEQAFGTLLYDYTIGRGTYRGRRGPLLLPPEIIPHVEAVLGLDNRPVAKPRLRSRNVQASYYPQELAAVVLTAAHCIQDEETGAFYDLSLEHNSKSVVATKTISCL